MAAMMLIIIMHKAIIEICFIHIIAAMSQPPHLISQLFHPGFLKAAPFLYSLEIFVRI